MGKRTWVQACPAAGPKLWITAPHCPQRQGTKELEETQDIRSFSEFFFFFFFLRDRWMLSERVSDGDERARLMKLRSEGDRKKMRFFLKKEEPQVTFDLGGEKGCILRWHSVKSGAVWANCGVWRKALLVVPYPADERSLTGYEGQCCVRSFACNFCDVWLSCSRQRLLSGQHTFLT